MATDCWYGRMIAQEPRPYHPCGIAGSFLTDPAALGLDAQASPTLQELVVVRRGRMDRVKAFISSVDEPGLRRVCVPPATPGHPVEPHTVLECLHVILDEEWEHGRYANRDLDLLQSPSR
jgi:hypothetical protein